MARGRRSMSLDTVRRLALLAWVEANPDVTVTQAAEHFGTDPDQIRRDVEVLWAAGPESGWEFIDFDADAWEAGRLRLRDDQGLAQPVRLTGQETVSVCLALAALSDLVRDDPALEMAVDQARDVLERAAGRPGLAGRGHRQAPGASEPDSPLVMVRRALAQGRALAIRYVSATDQVTTRVVEPIELIARDPSHMEVRAWCRSARAQRNFRIDRILEAKVLDDPIPASHRDRLDPARLGARGHALGTWGQEAVLHLAPSGAWMVEQVPHAGVEHHGDASLSLHVRGRDRSWLVGLVLAAGRSLLGVEPPELADAAHRAARQALEAQEQVRSQLAGEGE